jgi:hypothetical protein
MLVPFPIACFASVNRCCSDFQIPFMHPALIRVASE